MAILSPFRYPGAKNKLLPIIMKELDPLLKKTPYYTEPFVGGGSVALAVAELYPDMRILLNDKDPLIAAFWYCVVKEDLCIELNYRIKRNKADIKLFNTLSNSGPIDEVAKAYKAIMLNRLSFSGIIGAGPIGGKKQASKYKIDCRFDADDLISKINYCHFLLKGRTTVQNFDAISVLNGGSMYIDPPYMNVGHLLYPTRMNGDDHLLLSIELQKHHNWILSYDKNDFVKFLYKDNVIQDVETLYSVSNKKIHSKNAELLIRR